MKANKALQKLMADKPDAAEKFSELPGPVQEVLNIWATLKPMERIRTALVFREMHEAQKKGLAQA
jgi:hypothetical protein